MAKAKKRVAARKKSLKHGKASAGPARKLAAKRATPKKAKAKVRRTGMSAKKPAARQKRSPATREIKQAAELPVETTIIDAIKEPAGVGSGLKAASIPPGDQPEHGETIGPVGTPT